MRSFLVLAALLAALAAASSSARAAAAAPAPAPAAERWADWRPLMGEWEGDGSGEPGNGSGAFSFSTELQGRVLVRRSFAEYPAAAGRPAYRHDDLTLLDREEPGGAVRGRYYDNEGHVIDYRARVSAARDTFELTSDVVSGAPRYRLTCWITAPDSLRLRFEIAPPGKPDSLATYLEARAHRRAPQR